MKRAWIIRLGALLLVSWLAWKGWLKVEDNPGLMFIYFIFLGAAGGLLAVKFILPWMADALSTSIYSSGEKVNPEESGGPDETDESDDEPNLKNTQDSKET